MSRALISRSPDLQRLQDEGFELEVRSGFLLLHAIPYVNASRRVEWGTLVTVLTLNGDSTARPADHVVHFIGDAPCNIDGTEILPIRHSSQRQQLAPDLVVDRSFSNKPTQGYPDYHSKLVRYVEIISGPATAIDPIAQPQTFKVFENLESESPFLYFDSASTRAGIVPASHKFAGQRIAIVGLGGTGAYVLDLVAKTSLAEIHLFDGDDFLQHNAFRSPAAASIEDLSEKPFKVDYFAALYSKMRRGVVAHRTFLTEESSGELRGFDFAFVCVDSGQARKLIAEALTYLEVPFIDVGMGVEALAQSHELIGTLRVTAITPRKSDHFGRRVPVADITTDHAYATNVQTADLNALNAAFAVIKWKKLVGFYQDQIVEHHSTYSINDHLLTREEFA